MFEKFRDHYLIAYGETHSCKYADLIQFKLYLLVFFFVEFISFWQCLEHRKRPENI